MDNAEAPTKNLLFISHRMPWPLNKGEKIRGWNLLQHLSQTYRIHLGVVVDDPADMAHVPRMRTLCADVGAFPIDKRVQKFRALLRARPGRPLMPDFYFSPALKRWVNETAARTPMDVIYIYSVAMAPIGLHLLGRKLLDAQDIDSEKWLEYAAKARFPMRAVWAREARTLLAYERKAAAACEATFFVSQPEADRFIELAPETRGLVSAVECGVDLDRFNPGHPFPSPFSATVGQPHLALQKPSPPGFGGRGLGEGGGAIPPARSQNLVFTGNMDYWPNADAVTWFARDVMPLLRSCIPEIAFWIVGANPGADIRALQSLPGVHVTGRVEDVRPYVAHADAVVCPLRIARGIQNKVLEGMAMGRAVIASPPAFEGVRAEAGTDLLVADGAEAFVAAVTGVLAGHHPGLGASARAAMQRGYAWSAVLQALDRVLERVP